MNLAKHRCTLFTPKCIPTWLTCLVLLIAAAGCGSATPSPSAAPADTTNVSAPAQSAQRAQPTQTAPLTLTAQIQGGKLLITLKNVSAAPVEVINRLQPPYGVVNLLLPDGHAVLGNLGGDWIVEEPDLVWLKPGRALYGSVLLNQLDANPTGETKSVRLCYWADPEGFFLAPWTHRLQGENVESRRARIMQLYNEKIFSAYFELPVVPPADPGHFVPEALTPEPSPTY